jgi:hypothetical protein
LRPLWAKYPLLTAAGLVGLGVSLKVRLRGIIAELVHEGDNSMWDVMG